ncbi:hypothetical protein LF845_11715, partial [Deferribacterales bacterium Es71-Z0220]|uniref:hypothetical protein n=1 Tax=Deferrivibrio essentukiensis TaxID=2880922 RepID=UPI001F61BBB7
VVGYKDIYQLGVNKSKSMIMREIRSLSLEETRGLFEEVLRLKSIRIFAASIFFDLFKKFGISLFNEIKLLPTWRQL